MESKSNKEELDIDTPDGFITYLKKRFEELHSAPDRFSTYLKKRFEELICGTGLSDEGSENSREDRLSAPTEKENKNTNRRSDKTDASDLEQTDYKFDNPSRGLAIIINNEHFSGTRFRDRPGTSYDASSLYNSLTGLGFEVLMFQDLSSWQMRDVLRFANKEYDHSRADCFVCSILTHGEQTWSNKEWDRMGTTERLDVLFGTDGRTVKTKDVVEIFNDQNCPALKGKPRLFFLQACRGVGYDDGQLVLVQGTPGKSQPSARGGFRDGLNSQDETVSSQNSPLQEEAAVSPPHTVSEPQRLSSSMDPPEYNQLPAVFDSIDAAMIGLEEEEDSDGASDKTDAFWHQDIEIPVSPAPLYQDCLIMYATPPGFYAWRRDNGTWFIQSLCWVLDSNILDRVSLLRGLTYTCGKVAREYQSINPKKPKQHLKKEVPVIESMLVKDIFLTRKKGNSANRS